MRPMGSLSGGGGACGVHGPGVAFQEGGSQVLVEGWTGMVWAAALAGRGSGKAGLRGERLRKERTGTSGGLRVERGIGAFMTPA